MHLFQAGDTDLYAFTIDRTGQNLPRHDHSQWQYVETVDPVQIPWGDEEFNKVHQAVVLTGWFAFHGEVERADKMSATFRRIHYQRSYAMH
jgi:hypothetical protein